MGSASGIGGTESNTDDAFLLTRQRQAAEAGPVRSLLRDEGDLAGAAGMVRAALCRVLSRSGRRHRALP